MSFKLSRALRCAGVRHVHVHSCADAANLALFAHIFADVSYSLTLHNPVEVYGGNQRSKWIHAKFGIIITKAIRDDLLRSIPGLDPRNLVIAPMGVEVDVFNRVSDYKAFETGATLQLFCCARLNPAKGYSTLLAATKRLIQQGRQVSLRIAGEDDAGGIGYRRVLEALIQQLELGGCVLLLGAVSEEQVIAELERAHVFVLASDAEPLGVVLMEAMAMQVPVIATSAGGVPELVDEGVDGLLIPPKDVEALTLAIDRIAMDPVLARSLGKKGRNKIVSKFSPTHSARFIAALGVST